MNCRILTGSLGEASRPAEGELCRKLPFVPSTENLITRFDTDLLTTFTGDNLIVL